MLTGLGKIFGGGQVKCQRCEAKNDKDAEFCDSCGFALAALPPAILNDNCWEPSADELAVFFKTRHLDGLFSKLLTVPPGTRAVIMQDGQIIEVPPGEYSVEGFFGKINRLFRDKQSSILITRQAALPLDFKFDDILSAEFLRVTVATTLSVKVGDINAFLNHFTGTPGTVTTQQLEELLRAPVRQIVAEFIAPRRLHEIATQGDLRDEIDRALTARLQHRFREYGLAFDAADTLSISHARFNENRERMGEVWLDVDTARVKIEQAKSLDELYSQNEWQKIRNHEDELRQKYRNDELTREEAEQGHVIRLREIDLLEKTTNAESRAVAIKCNALDQIEELQQQLHKKGLDREDEVIQWNHIRELASIRLATEQLIYEEQNRESREIESLRVDNELKKIKTRNLSEQSRLVEDEELRAQRASFVHKAESASNERSQEILKWQHQVAHIDIDLVGRAKNIEFERMQVYEEAVNDARIANVQRVTRSSDRQDKLESLRALQDIDMQGARNEISLNAERAAQRERTLDAGWQRDLQKLGVERELKFEEVRLELERAKLIGELPLSAQIAAAGNPQVAATLAELAKTEAYKGMSVEAILAAGGAVSAQGAEALKAKFASDAASAKAAEDLRQQNEKLMREMLERQDAVNKRSQELQSGTFETAIDKMKDAVVGVAQGGAGRYFVPPVHNTVIAGGAGHQTGARGVVCVSCNFVNAPGVRYCGGCGTQLF